MHVGAGVFMPVAATSFASFSVPHHLIGCHPIGHQFITRFFNGRHFIPRYFANHSAHREVAVPYAVPS